MNAILIKKSRAIFVVHFCIGLVMRISVNFDNKPKTRTVEIYDIGTNAVLTTKLPTKLRMF